MASSLSADFSRLRISINSPGFESSFSGKSHTQSVPVFADQRLDTARRLEANSGINFVTRKPQIPLDRFAVLA
jgi:hypothetical protein